MRFQVDLSGAKPVYQQLIDQIKIAVASGRLQSGDRLPTVRDVAVQVRVNRNTVARVYSELEREGLLYTRAGQGTFVSDRGSSVNRAEQRRQLTASFNDLLAQAKLFGYSREQVVTLFTDRLNTMFPETPGVAEQAPAGAKR